MNKKNIKKLKKNADLILASNVFAHSDKLNEMAECMFELLSTKGTIVIEVQYLMNTLKDLTFDNIYHEHYNYWSLTSIKNFFDNLGNIESNFFLYLKPCDVGAIIPANITFISLSFCYSRYSIVTHFYGFFSVR